MNNAPFDKACEEFTESMLRVVGWKHNYNGAVYGTRLILAMQEARKACETLEAKLNELGELR